MPTAPVTYPLGPPTVSGTTITVDVALNQPTRILRDIARLTDQKFFASRVFSDAGGVEGGAVLFELPPTTQTDLFAERGVQEVAPGEEFPVLTFLRGVPVVAKPRKIGGKSWATAAGTTMTTRSGTNVATADLLAARKQVELEQRGHTLDSALLHPNQELSLLQAAAAMGVTIDQLLATAGIRNWFSSARVTAGTAILYEAGQVGGWANEFPLAQDTWYENEIESTWFQWSVSPAMFIDDPFGIVQLTGIA
jgi:hypothetical protein